MLEQEFTNLINEFGTNVRLNDETITRKVIISSESQSDNVYDFDDRKVSTNFPITRGDTMVIGDVHYLVINDVQMKRGTGEYKSVVRPMSNVFNYTYMTEGVIIEYDRMGTPIYADGQEPQEITEPLPCIAYQEGSPTLTSGQIVMPETRIKVIMPDNEVTALIEMNSDHTVLNHNYKIEDINLLQSGIRIFTMEWTTQ